jgi:DNA-directed RNA polymerase specialized sigma24 family protein
MATHKREGDDQPDKANEYPRLTVALLACLARELRDSGDQIQVMDSFGVSSPMIAKALGISPVSVRTALHRRRHAKGR